jgi:hypothetical protein
MIQFQNLLYKDEFHNGEFHNGEFHNGENISIKDELVGMNIANTQYEDAKIVTIFLNSYKDHDIIEYNIDEKEKLLKEIKQIISGTILI